MTTDPFGRAILDHHRGKRDEPLLQRDGPRAREHPIERFYFEDVTEGAAGELTEWLESWLDGPLLDMGAGAGKHALYFQEEIETVAIEVSENLVTTMDERGVENTRQGDMFALPERFDEDRFQSALAYGTQVGLAGSMAGLRGFFEQLATVTAPDATVVLDCYDPTEQSAHELLGYRDDPTAGLAYRVMQFEYEGSLGEILLFRLFSPDRMREAATDSGWTVAELRRGDGDSPHYLVALEK